MTREKNGYTSVSERSAMLAAAEMIGVSLSGEAKAMDLKVSKSGFERTREGKSG